MYKLYGKDGSEKKVETNTDRNEHIKSGFYSEKKQQVKTSQAKEKKINSFDAKDAIMKPSKRKGI